jgi:beta-lactamase regulating signal transducer with metallopeptidase domain/uncharacterized GH25 family protein
MTWIVNRSFSYDVGMTLVHSVWQILLVAAIFAVANRLLARGPANLRYVTAYASLLFMLVLPLVTLVTLASQSRLREYEASRVAQRPESSRSVDVPAYVPFRDPIEEITMPPAEISSELAAAPYVVSTDNARDTAVNSDPVSPLRWSSILPWLSVAWSLGVIGLSLRPLLALYDCRRMRSEASRISVPWITDAFPSLCKQIGLKQVVQIASSARVQVPTVIGFVRPIVLLPISVLTQQTPDELTAIIAHELAHVRRHDFVLNLLQTAIETLLFYHPAVWWVSAIVRQERENCCDDVAMAICGRRNYATALAKLEFARSASTDLALAADGGSLYRRIHRIVRPNECPHPLGRFLAALVALTALLLGVAAVLPTYAVAVADDGQAETDGVETDGAEALATGVDGDSARRNDGEPRPANAIRTYAGKVFGPDGQPVAGVTVYVENTNFDRKRRIEVSQELQSTVTADDGSYSLTFQPKDGNNQVIAAKEGYGPAVVGFDVLHELFEQGKEALDLRLARDVPIIGRVVDTEGNSLADVTVTVDQFSLPVSDDAVAEWIDKERPELFQGRERNSLMLSDSRILETAFPISMTIHHGSAIPASVTTAADGSFRLAGIGRNRRVQLMLAGSNIAQQRAIVVTRQMNDIVAFAHEVRDGDYTHHGASPTLVASSAQRIVGQVVDGVSKAPLPNVPVRLARIGKETWLAGTDPIQAVTDDDGRFEILGAPLGGQHLVEVHPPPNQPYFRTSRELPVASGSAPLECNFTLPQTKWIRGRVTDDQGNPIVAMLEFYPHRDNSHAEAFTKFDPNITGRGPSEECETDETGSFRIKAIPGPAVLAAFAKDETDRKRFMPNRDADLLERIGGQDMTRLYDSWSADYFDALVEVNLPVDEDEVTQDLVFKQGWSRRLLVTDNNGQPVSRVTAMGHTFPPRQELVELDDSGLDIVGLQRSDTRLVVLMDKERELGRVLNFSIMGADHDATNIPLSAELLPCAVATGRVVDEEGRGVMNLRIRVHAIKELRADSWAREVAQVMTDEHGRFRVTMPPGGAFHVSAYTDLGPNFQATIRTESGAAYELGDLKHNDELKESDTTQLAAKKEPVLRGEAANAIDSVSIAPSPSSTRIHGRVLGTNGQGLMAKLYVVQKYTGQGTKPGSEQVLHQTESSRDGQFDFSVPLPMRDQTIDRRFWNARVLQLVAVANGYGPTASDMIDLRQGKATELRLTRDDVPIQGTIRTLEGEPVVGATVRVVMLESKVDVDERIESLRKQAQTEEQPSMISGVFQVPSLFAPGLDPDTNERIAARSLDHSQFTSNLATTDPNGRFELTGVGRDRMLALELSGPGIVTSWISVISREMEPIDVAMFIGARIQKTFGARFTFLAEPAQAIVGRITDADTGQPIEGVLVEATESSGASANVRAVTDADGRYRLVGLPMNERDQVDITPPSSMPYLARQNADVPDVVRGRFARGVEDATANFQLRRTKWYTGRIVDKRTGKPVAARISYSPRTDNPMAEQYPAFVKGRYSTDAFNEDRNSVATDQDGRFRIRVIQGDGMLFVRCNEPIFLTGVGQDLLKSDAKWWGYEQNRMTNTFHPMFPELVHRLWPIRVGDAADKLVHDISVDSGQTFDVQMIDLQGQPLSDVTVVNRLPHGSSLSERPTESDRVTIPAIATNGPRAVFFYHKQRNLAACLVVPGPMDSAARNARELEREHRTVQLQPCATVKGRLLDRNGKPLANARIGIRPMALGDITKRYVIAQTDKDGNFTADQVIPHTSLAFHEMQSPRGAEIYSINLQPGETRDFGEVTLDFELRSFEP